MTIPQPTDREIVPAELLQRLSAEIEATLAARREHLEGSPDPDDIAMAYHGLAGRAVEEAEAALARIDAGTYGICEKCQSAIALARLEAVPQTRFCMNCAR